MASVLALLSKSFFEKHCRIEGRVAKAGDVVPLDRYVSASARLKKLLKGGGTLVLVTVRPNEELLLVAILEGARYRSAKGFVAESPNAITVRKINSTASELTLANGKGLTWKPGRMAMSLQTPRELSESDVTLLRSPTPGGSHGDGPSKRDAKRIREGIKKADEAIRNHDHSSPVRAILKARFARFDGPRPTREESPNTLREHGYDPHDPAVTFDNWYGGLIFAAEDRQLDGKSAVTADWTLDDTMGWMIGPSACLKSGAHGDPRGGEEFLELYGEALQLVPVAYGPADDIYYVDGVGRGYYHDTCYDLGGPHLVADSLWQLFARIVLQHWLQAKSVFKKRGKLSIGRRVAELSKLPQLKDATGTTQRWWGKGLTVVSDMIDLPVRDGPPVRWITWGASDDAARLKTR